ncbi:acetyl-CoA carboxylase biotin carboxyl carrier protein subunit [Erwinia sp. E_sp_B04_7]|uniref:acetyl-CoA carboxylase biotin carboxyl carrier protein subunit n=1 Tax=unclassified Erwinia TaxID=2622719 RepID=UPI0030CD9462
MENRAPALRDLRQIAQKMWASGLSSIEISGGNYRVHMKYAALPPAPLFQPFESGDLPVAAPATRETLCAPMPGIVLLQHPLSDQPFTRPGLFVRKNTLLGLLKVGLLYLPLRSPGEGVVGVIAEQGDRVEFGAGIFTLEAQEAAA